MASPSFAAAENGIVYFAWEGARGGGGLMGISYDGTGIGWRHRDTPYYDPSQFGWEIVSRSLDLNTRTGKIFQSVGAEFSDHGGGFAGASTDHGVSWQGSGVQGGEIVSNHGDGQHVYTRSESGEIRRSTDGVHFVEAGVLPSGGVADGRVSPRTMMIDAADSERLFAIANGHEVHLSTDAAESWESRSTGLPASDESAPLQALFMRSSDGDFLQVVNGDGDVFRTTDGGGSWSLWRTIPLEGTALVDATWDPSSGHVFAATSGIGVASTHLLFDSADLPDRTPLSVHYSRPARTLFVGTSHAGLWQCVVLPEPAEVVQGDRSGDGADRRGGSEPSPGPRGDKTDLHLPEPVRLRDHDRVRRGAGDGRSTGGVRRLGAAGPRASGGRCSSGPACDRLGRSGLRRPGRGGRRVLRPADGVTAWSRRRR